MLDCLFIYFFGQWLKRKPMSSNSMLVNRIIYLVSFLFFIWFKKKNLFINYEFLVHGFRFCCFSFGMQKLAWIREFLLKFTNFKVKINLISIIYEIFIRSVCVFGSYFLFSQMQICTAHFFLQICTHPSLQGTDFTSFSWLDLIL